MAGTEGVDPESQGFGYTALSDVETRPIWELWEGRNQFLCSGKVMAGPEVRFPVGVFLLLVASLTTFVIYICPHVPEPAAFIAAATALGVCMAWALLRTSLTEPGIIARQPRVPAIARECLEGDSVFVRWKFCPTCNTYKPPRAKHCAFSDNCIKRFDHYCPWVGNSVGLRNYRPFFLFLVATTLYSLEVLVTTGAVLLDAPHGIGNAIARSRTGAAAIALVVIGVPMTLLVGGLMLYHAFLISTNQTTNEHVNGYFRDSPNPFHRGFWANWVAFLCRPVPPSELPAPDTRIRVHVDRDGYFLRPAIAKRRDLVRPRDVRRALRLAGVRLRPGVVAFGVRGHANSRGAAHGTAPTVGHTVDDGAGASDSEGADGSWQPHAVSDAERGSGGGSGHGRGHGDGGGGGGGSGGAPPSRGCCAASHGGTHARGDSGDGYTALPDGTTTSDAAGAVPAPGAPPPAILPGGVVAGAGGGASGGGARGRRHGPDSSLASKATLNPPTLGPGSASRRPASTHDATAVEPPRLPDDNGPSGVGGGRVADAGVSPGGPSPPHPARAPGAAPVAVAGGPRGRGDSEETWTVPRFGGGSSAPRSFVVPETASIPAGSGFPFPIGSPPAPGVSGVPGTAAETAASPRAVSPGGRLRRSAASNARGEREARHAARAARAAAALEGPTAELVRDGRAAAHYGATERWSGAEGHPSRPWGVAEGGAVDGAAGADDDHDHDASVLASAAVGRHRSAREQTTPPAPEPAGPSPQGNGVLSGLLRPVEARARDPELKRLREGLLGEAM